MKRSFCLYKYYVLNAIYCILGAPSPGLVGAKSLSTGPVCAIAHFGCNGATIYILIHG